MKPYVVLEDVCKTFGRGPREVHAVQHVDLTVAEGELVALRGRSGSGKTTLINCIGGLDAATSGRIRIGEHEVTAMDEAQILQLRRRTIAYVFQSFGLIPVLTVAENVSVPLRLERLAPRERDARVAEVLEMVDLAHHAEHLPGQLSGGQQQRVALARALVARPRLLLADEPTGQLDSETGATIMGLIGDLVRDTGMTALIATHDDALMRFADRVVEMRDGRLLDAAEVPPGPVPVRAGKVSPAPVPSPREEITPEAARPDTEEAHRTATRSRTLPLVGGLLAVTLLTTVSTWAALRGGDQGGSPSAVAPPTASSTRATGRGQERLRLGLPEWIRPTEYLVPPSRDKAMTGDYTDAQADVLTLERKGTRLVLTEKVAGEASGRPLEVKPGPPGWWTATTRAGLGITVQAQDEDADAFYRLAHRPATPLVALGLLQPLLAGVSVHLWSRPVVPSELERAFYLEGSFYDGQGARLDDAAAEKLGRRWSQPASQPWLRGCEGAVRSGSVATGELHVEADLPDTGPRTTIDVALADTGVKASAQQADTVEEGGTNRYILGGKLPAETYAAVIASDRRADPRLAITKITWKGVSGATWTWEKPTLDNIHASLTCPVRSGAPAAGATGRSTRPAA